MDGCVSVGGVKIDDSVSYAAAACWAGVIDNENHVNSLSLWANGGHSKGSAKIVMLRGRTDTLRWRLDRTEYAKLCPAICRHLRGRLPQVIHRLPPELRSHSKLKWATHFVSGWKGASTRRQTEDGERWPASTCDIQNGLSELVGVPRAFWGGSLGFHRDIARGAVKDDAVHGFENRKAFGNAIHLYIERAIHL